MCDHKINLRAHWIQSNRFSIDNGLESFNLRTMSTHISIAQLQQKKIGILGVGVEGRATIDYLLRHGIDNIEALDRNPIANLPHGVSGTFGDMYLDRLERFDVIFRSPGFRPDMPALAPARQSGCHITSAISFFLENCPAKTIGITGTVGKGTASSLTADALAACGFTVHLGGNIGKSPLTFLDDVKADDVVVLELSSFQTMDVSASPDIVCVLKTTTEHLDWHVDTNEYRKAKAHLLSHQSPHHACVFNADSEGAREIAAVGPGKHYGFSLTGEVDEGLFLNHGILTLRINSVDTPLSLKIDNVALAGRFNLENISAAILLGHLLGADLDTLCHAAAAFEGLPHRLQRVAESDGVAYYNDSYATRPDAAQAAISAFTKPLALIMGGSEKNADFTELFEFIHSRSNIVSITLIGATAERMQNELTAMRMPDFRIQRAADLATAMTLARQTLTSGGVLLMAPACASFGLFNNYKERGEQFTTLAQQMAGDA
ncbi:MAG: UDP-N-acetylmuramoyl-L-alanine--D-glutamate ligase [Deltaproteobacteria bacterium]|nr:UDP-N-acetylmuramoyl-L-alanine--D-glutamate ligase [Deltaproteobacteria bacterium]